MHFPTKKIFPVLVFWITPLELLSPNWKRYPVIYFRELGYDGASQHTIRSYFGEVSDEFGMDEVQCTGNETSILDCPHQTSDNCGGSEGLGVICSSGEYNQLPRVRYKSFNCSLMVGRYVDRKVFGQAMSPHQCGQMCQRSHVSRIVHWGCYLREGGRYVGFLANWPPENWAPDNWAPESWAWWNFWDDNKSFPFNS